MTALTSGSSSTISTRPAALVPASGWARVERSAGGALGRGRGGAESLGDKLARLVVVVAHQHGPAPVGAQAKRMTKGLPRPGALSTVSVAPLLSERLRATASPSPIPRGFVVNNGSKIFP